MKLTPKSKHPKPAPLLAFGPHPDDLEFACGGVLALERRAGRPVHLVICSKGEAGTHGTPGQRVREAKEAARILGATIEFIQLDGDSHLEIRSKHTLRLAAIIRRVRPAIILAPTLVENQHPDHSKLGRLVSDAARVARYGGVKELRSQPPHTVGLVFFYAVTSEAEPSGITPVLLDVSDAAIQQTWRSAMEAHASQTSARAYVELQLARSRLWGLRAGIGHAIALFPQQSPLLTSLAVLEHGANRF